MTLFGGIIVLFFIATANMVIGITDVKAFLSQTGSIRTSHDLKLFKRMARKQMYQALLQIVFLGIMGMLGVIGIASRKLSLSEFLIFLLLNVIMIVLGIYGRKFENKARSFQADNDILAKEYRSVCESWVKKPFPDF
jgi:hypothetical protein